MAAVSANDVNQTQLQNSQDMESAELSVSDSEVLKISSDEVISQSESDETLSANSTKSSSPIETSYKFTGNTTSIRGSKVSFQIKDANGKKLSNKSVQVSINGKVKNLTTNSKGVIKYKLVYRGVHNLNFYFNEAGYKPINYTKKLIIVDSPETSLKASNYVAYQGFKNPFKVTLAAGSVKLPGKKITFKINGKTYTSKTNSKGVATLNIDLKKGNYTIKYSYAAQKNLNASSGKSKITVKKGMPVTIKKANSVSYAHLVTTPFKVKVLDARGNAVANKSIVLKINGKKNQVVNTSSSGVAKFSIKLAKGVYTLGVYSYATSKYVKASKSFKINVKTSSKKDNNGFWLFGADMKKVNLNQMAKSGINHIFLNFYAVTLHGEKAVSDFALKAGKLKIKVHIWMQAFYDGGWVSPLNSDGTYKYSLYKSLINKAKSYACIAGIDGIHFDYLRFPGTAYKYKNSVDAINYFTKQACSELHKLNTNLIVSAAVMPEPSSNKYYYGQDIATLSKYLDVIVPMIYKGNYNKDASWIKSVTSTFVKQSNGAQIWSGLQGYYSDGNVNKLPASTLQNDAKYAKSGGACGIIIFRYSLFNLFDFKVI